MNGKITSNKAWKKTGFGILFVAACFMAMYILMEFHEVVWLVVLAAVVLLGAAFLFFHAVFSDKTKTPGASFEAADDTAVGGGEFHLKIVKHMKDMENSQKEMVEVLKSQNALLQAQTENLENSLFSLSEKQSNQTKSIIKFNKENARQLAISERETLEYIMLELKSAIEENGGGAMRIPASAPVAALEEVTGDELFEVEEFEPDDDYTAPAPVAPVPEEIPEEIAPLFEESAPVEEPSLDELLMPTQEEDPFEEVATSEEMEIPELPDDLDLSQLFDIPELEEEPAVAEPVVEEESAPAANPLETLSADPNAMMTPEDIAKLLEAMGQ